MSMMMINHANVSRRHHHGCLFLLYYPGRPTLSWSLVSGAASHKPPGWERSSWLSLQHTETLLPAFDICFLSKIHIWRYSTMTKTTHHCKIVPSVLTEEFTWRLRRAPFGRSLILMLNSSQLFHNTSSLKVLEDVLSWESEGMVVKLCYICCFKPSVYVF